MAGAQKDVKYPDRPEEPSSQPLFPVPPPLIPREAWVLRGPFTADDFLHFGAILHTNKTWPDALFGLQPLQVYEPELEYRGVEMVFKFSEQDAKTICERFYSDEEAGRANEHLAHRKALNIWGKEVQRLMRVGK